MWTFCDSMIILHRLPKTSLTMIRNTFVTLDQKASSHGMPQNSQSLKWSGDVNYRKSEKSPSSFLSM